MLHRLRQVNFIVDDLDHALGLYRSHLGMSAMRRYRTMDGQRAVLHAGDGTFVELWHPELGDAEPASFREARGQGPYEMVFETKDLDAIVRRADGMRVRHSGISNRPERRTVVIDTTEANGALLRIVEVVNGAGFWPLAGAPDAEWPEAGTLRLRQVAVLVRDLDHALAQWSELFQLQATKRFQVSFTDLEIAVLPLLGRDTFIELAQSTGPDSPSQRFLDRYGEGIYLTIYEIADSLATDSRLQDQGARFTTSRQTANYTNLGFNSIWLHPAGFMGAFTQLSQVLSPDNPWPPAGEDWHLQ
jgi:catechol 2,3-dioxygenase-like lactoylglutathione lyase family enzyme